MVDAQRCTLGAANQCQQVVPAHLSPCDSCLTHVNDSATVLLLEDQWRQLGCDGDTGSTCGQIVCPTSTNTTCVDTGNGTGKCSFSFSAGDAGPDASP